MQISEHKVSSGNGRSWRNLFLCLPQLSSSVNGWSNGSGSGDITSNPAEKIVPFFNASIRSSCTTMSPRATFTNTLLDFIFEKAFRSNMCLVSSFNGHETKTKSLCCSSSSNDTNFAFSAPPADKCILFVHSHGCVLNSCRDNNLAEIHDVLNIEASRFRILAISSQFSVQCHRIQQCRRLSL